MLSLHSFGLFVIAALVLLLIPGPAVLYITTRSIDQGRMAGLISVFGIALGGCIIAVCAAAGLSAILVSSDIAFSIVKYLGAAYLVYLGLKRLLSKDDSGEVTIQRKRLSQIFIQGIVVQISNPKTALFFLAFLPQFVDVSRGAVWEQTLILGLTFVILAFCTDSIYALLAGTAGNWLKGHQGGFQKGQRYITGGIYLTLGAISALSGSSKHS